MSQRLTLVPSKEDNRQKLQGTHGLKNTEVRKALSQKLR
jgi:hypothetical protein